MTAIGKLYGMNLINGKKTIAQVPAKYKADAIEYCYTQVQAGKITPEYFEQITGVPYEPYAEDKSADAELNDLVDALTE